MSSPLMANMKAPSPLRRNDAFKRSLVDALKRLSESNQLKMSNNNSNWWRFKRLVSLASDQRFQRRLSRSFKITSLFDDLKSILDNVSWEVLKGQTFLPFLLEGASGPAARFVQIMPPPIIDRFLQVTVTLHF